MKSHSNIRQTLKANLFTSPNPVIGNELYESVRHHLFPNEDLFISFLDEQNLQYQIQKAKEILLLLSYRTTFPAPSRLLLNILDHESSLSGKHQPGFVSRDHFIHLVNLYLLGNYIFLYHKSLNQNVTGFFEKLRRKVNSDTKVSKSSIDKILDFSFAWKTFVLYHDIGYPIEYWIGEDESIIGKNKEDVIRHLTPFNEISTSIIQDLTLRALTKLVWVEEIILQRNWESLIQVLDVDEILESNFDQAKIPQTQEWKEYYHIDKVYAQDTLNTLRSIFEKDGIMYVLVKENGEVLSFILENEKKFTRFDTIRTKELIGFSRENLEGYCQSIEVPKGIDAEWKVFIKSPVKRFKDFMNKQLPIVQYSGFQKVCKVVIENCSTKYNFISDKYSAFQHQFDIYLYLFEAYFPKVHDASYSKLTAGEFTQHVYNTVLENAHKQITNEIKNVVGQDIEEFLKSSKINIKNQDVESFLKEIFSSIIKDPAQKANDVYKKINKKIRDDIATQELRKHLWDEFSDKWNDKLNTEISAYTQERNDVETKDHLDFKYGDLLNTPLGEEVKNRLRRIGLNDFYKEGNYKPDFAKERGKFCDHGVTASILALDIFNIYGFAADVASYINPSTTGLPDLVSLDDIDPISQIAFGIQSMPQNLIALRLKQILPEVIMSIALHNIYPSGLTQHDDKRYINSIDASPFNFFCILSDSLQPWDRKRNENNALKKSGYTTFGNKFDLKIFKDKIFIHEEGDGVNINDRINALRTYLAEYLQDTKSLIKLSFGEYEKTS